jgi:hypothetical protein
MYGDYTDALGKREKVPWHPVLLWVGVLIAVILVVWWSMG